MISVRSVCFANVLQKSSDCYRCTGSNSNDWDCISVLSSTVNHIIAESNWETRTTYWTSLTQWQKLWNNKLRLLCKISQSEETKTTQVKHDIRNTTAKYKIASPPPQKKRKKKKRRDELHLVNCLFILTNQHERNIYVNEQFILYYFSWLWFFDCIWSSMYIEC